jgi:hypothetical protein
VWYSGKKKDFGGNVQAVFYPDGRPLWISDVLPGNVNDLAGKGARDWCQGQACHGRQNAALA